MLSLTGKQWVLEHDSIEPDVVGFLFQKRRLSDVPFTPPEFPDGHKAIARMEHAIASNERIAIFGDYDCDGITATAQLVRFFRKKGVQPLVRLPHRIYDGYGLKDHIISEFIEKKIGLLITVDTGISSGLHIERLKMHGIDVIVIDHHEPPTTLPRAHTIIHPVLAHSTDPYPCAAGIVHALLPEKDEVDTALACIGTIADVVELKGWNRTLVQNGLQILRSLQDCPLTQLKEQANVRTLTAKDIGFYLAPRINAAGRMDDPMIALTALLEGGEALALLEKLNTERQVDTRAFLEDAIKSVGGSPPPFICIASPLYPPGIVGLLAGKLAERYGRPALVGSIQGSECTASIRNPLNIHISRFLSFCDHLLSSHGGHARAAGCTFPVQNFTTLRDVLSQRVVEEVPESHLVPTLFIDLLLHSQCITLNLCERIRQLEPFGEGNPEPRFLLQNVRLTFPRQVGSVGSHLQAKIEGRKCVGFGLGRFVEQTKDPIDMVCRLGIDTWNSREEPRLFIEDIRLPVHTGASFPSM